MTGELLNTSFVNLIKDVNSTSCNTANEVAILFADLNRNIEFNTVITKSIHSFSTLTSSRGRHVWVWLDNNSAH